MTRIQKLLRFEVECWRPPWFPASADRVTAGYYIDQDIVPERIWTLYLVGHTFTDGWSATRPLSPAWHVGTTYSRLGLPARRHRAGRSGPVRVHVQREAAQSCTSGMDRRSRTEPRVRSETNVLTGRPAERLHRMDGKNILP